MRKALIALALGLSTLTAPAMAGGSVAAVQPGNTPVSAEAHKALTDYNTCVSRVYRAGTNRPEDLAMGRFRDNVTRANRAVAARNKAVFDSESRSAAVNGQDAVGSACTYRLPAAPAAPVAR